MPQTAWLSRFAVSVLLLGALSHCKSKAEQPKAAASASAKPPAAPSASVAERRVTRPIALPAGPELVILAGQGVGPIRIGATTKTINRLMDAPCDVKTESVCRYIDRGVEFHLKDDVTERIYVHRRARPAGKDASGAEREYGFFNGGMLPDLRMGMIPSEIRKVLGTPKRTEKIDTPNPYNTVERDHYEGLVIEYDRIENGNLIWAGAIITKPDKQAQGK